ncbi:hypothetical protein [Brachybacterium sp. UNK5269]|uniref:hypothetical protein n=1 Tax=Brachybacterium sp. UNK5269 TaxID=3408576 RepID=UPI003BAF4B24
MSVLNVGMPQVAIGVLALLADVVFFDGVKLVSVGTIFLAGGIVLTIIGLLVRRHARRLRTEAGLEEPE